MVVNIQVLIHVFKSAFLFSPLSSRCLLMWKTYLTKRVEFPHQPTFTYLFSRLNFFLPTAMFICPFTWLFIGVFFFFLFISSVSAALFDYACERCVLSECEVDVPGGHLWSASSCSEEFTALCFIKTSGLYIGTTWIISSERHYYQ